MKIILNLIGICIVCATLAAADRNAPALSKRGDGATLADEIGHEFFAPYKPKSH
jgi:hypothetical protein